MLLYHVAFLTLLVGTALFFTWLAARDVRHADATVRAEREWLADVLGVDDHEELLSYHRLTTAFGELREWSTLLVLLLVLYLGGFRLAVEAAEALGVGPVVTGVVFFGGAVVASRLFGLPFAAANTFGLQEAFEFNRSSRRLWVRDQLVGTAVSVALTAVVVAGILWFAATFPTFWWVFAWAFVVAFLLVMQVLYPRVIAPLFNEFEPVEAGELRETVEEVFDRAGFETEGIYVMDASRRSAKVNAYFTGFGDTKRVVLFDTLVEQLSPRGAGAVLAHELAHWKRGHVPKRIAATAVRLLAVFALVGWLVDAAWLYAMFGVPEVTYAGLFLAALWIHPLLELSGPVENRLSLAHEREADDYATDVMGDPEPLVSALSKLARENLSNPFPDPLYATFHYSHPPIPERIRRLQGATGPEGADGADGSPPESGAESAESTDSSADPAAD